MKQGKELIVLVGGTVVGASRTCTYDLQQEFIESRSPYSGRTTAKIPTGYSWSVHCACLCVSMAEVKTFTDAVRNGTAITLRFRDSDFVYDYTGTAFVQSLSATGENKALAQYSIDFIGSGDLSEQPWTTITLTPTETVNNVYIDCNGTTPVLTYREGDNTYLRQITVSVPTVIEIATTRSNACMFLHHASADTVAEKIQAINTEAFLSSATTGYMAHVHGTTGMYRTALQPGTYTITWDASPTGTVKVKS